MLREALEAVRPKVYAATDKASRFTELRRAVAALLSTDRKVFLSLVSRTVARAGFEVERAKGALAELRGIYRVPVVTNTADMTALNALVSGLSFGFRLEVERKTGLLSDELKRLSPALVRKLAIGRSSADRLSVGRALTARYRSSTARALTLLLNAYRAKETVTDLNLAGTGLLSLDKNRKFLSDELLDAMGYYSVMRSRSRRRGLDPEVVLTAQNGGRTKDPLLDLGVPPYRITDANKTIVLSGTSMTLPLSRAAEIRFVLPTTTVTFEPPQPAKATSTVAEPYALRKANFPSASVTADGTTNITTTVREFLDAVPGDKVKFAGITREIVLVYSPSSVKLDATVTTGVYTGLEVFHNNRLSIVHNGTAKTFDVALLTTINVSDITTAVNDAALSVTASAGKTVLATVATGLAQKIEVKETGLTKLIGMSAITYLGRDGSDAVVYKADGVTVTKALTGTIDATAIATALTEAGKATASVVDSLTVKLLSATVGETSTLEVVTNTTKLTPDRTGRARGADIRPREIVLPSPYRLVLTSASRKGKVTGAGTTAATVVSGTLVANDLVTVAGEGTFRVVSVTGATAVLDRVISTGTFDAVFTTETAKVTAAQDSIVATGFVSGTAWGETTEIKVTAGEVEVGDMVSGLPVVTEAKVLSITAERVDTEKTEKRSVRTTARFRSDSYERKVAGLNPTTTYTAVLEKSYPLSGLGTVKAGLAATKDYNSLRSSIHEAFADPTVAAKFDEELSRHKEIEGVLNRALAAESAVPSELAEAETKLATLSTQVGKFPPLGSTLLDAVIADMAERGMGRARDLLLDGEISKFFSISPDEASYHSALTAGFTAASSLAPENTPEADFLRFAGRMTTTSLGVER